MVTQWYVEAGKYNVLPWTAASCSAHGRAPRIAIERKSYTYYPGTQVVSALVAADVGTVPIASLRMRISPRKELRALLSLSGCGRRISIYIKDGRLSNVHKYVGKEIMIVRSEETVPPDPRAEVRVLNRRKPDIQPAKDRPVGPSSISTRSWWARLDGGYDSAIVWDRCRLVGRRRCGLADYVGLQGALPFTGKLL